MEILKRLGIVLIVGLILYGLSFVDPCLQPKLTQWWYLNIPMRILVGFGNGIIIGCILILSYSCIWPFIELTKWIIKGSKS